MQFQEQTTDFHQEAKTAARSRIAEIFNHPDDLANNFASFSKKLSSEKSLVETQLNAAAMLQYDQAQQGLDALAFAKSTSLVVRKNLIEIDRLCSDAQSSIKNYDKIKIISSTHQNMSTTKEMVLQFQVSLY